MKIKKKLPPRPSRPAAAAPAKTTAAPAPAARAEVATGAGVQYRQVHELVRADMIAYRVWREWHRARERGDYPFVYDLTSEDGPLREAFGEATSFAEAARRKLRPMPGLQEGEFLRLHLNGPNDVQLLQLVGFKERDRSEYTVERFHILRGAQGWRIHGIDAITLPRTEGPETVRFSQFPAVTRPAWCQAFEDTDAVVRAEARTAEKAARAARKAAEAEAATAEG